jgi:hypothetical protein
MTRGQIIFIVLGLLLVAVVTAWLLWVAKHY